MSLILYADFSCPDCYLAAHRADILTAAGVLVDFRAVEHRPGLSVRGRRPTAADRDALGLRFADLQGVMLPGEELPWVMPPLIPKTEAAVSAYSEVYGSPVDAEVRRLLLQLYWREGADIGDPNVLRSPLAGPALRSGSDADPLRQVGYAVSVARSPITTDAWRRIRAWREQWQQLGDPGLPMLLVDGATLHGVDAVRRLGKEIIYVGAEVNPDLPDPRRYPHVEVRPSLSWVSQVGGRWRNVYRPSGVAEA